MHVFSVSLGQVEAGVLPRVDGGDAAEPVARIHGQKFVFLEVALRDLVDSLRYARDGARELRLFHALVVAESGRAGTQRLVVPFESYPVRRDDAHSGDDYTPIHSSTP